MAYAIRHLTPNEALQAVAWAEAEGWNPGREDMSAFLTQDPRGFLGGFLDGELVATISAVRYPGNFSFIGFYIVRPEHRGKGLGIMLWNAGMEQLRGCNCGLDGVMAQVANYEKSGFHFAHQNRRYSGTPRLSQPRGSGAIVDARAIPIGELAAFDRQFFPAERLAFLAVWLTLPNRVSRAFVEDGQIAGYGVLRPSASGWRIGPLFAARPDIAAALFHALCRSLPEGETLAIDVPLNQPAAVSLAESAGLVPVFETARMYTGAPPPVKSDGIFGLTSFELG